MLQNLMNIYTQSLSTAKASARLPNGPLRRLTEIWKSPFFFIAISHELLCFLQSSVFPFYPFTLFSPFSQILDNRCFHPHLPSFHFLFPLVSLSCFVLLYFSVSLQCSFMASLTGLHQQREIIISAVFLQQIVVNHESFFQLLTLLQMASDREYFTSELARQNEYIIS